MRRIRLKLDRRSLVAVSLVGALALSNATFAASEWEEQIRKVVPANITLTDVEKKPTHLRIVGQAKDNADISKLMRAIDQANLGSPELEMIRRADDMSNFVLNIQPTR